MRLVPAEIRVKRGDIVRFIVTNDSRLPQGGARHDGRARAARRGDAQSFAPGAPRGERAGGRAGYGCLTPGRFEAGTMGKVLVY